MSRHERCNRFLREFGPDAERAMKLKSPVEITYQNLAFVDGEDVVRFCIGLRDADGNETEFVSDCVWFDPDESYEEDTVDRVSTLLDEPEYNTALRLKRADLINGDPDEYKEGSGDAAASGDVPDP